MKIPPMPFFAVLLLGSFLVLPLQAADKAPPASEQNFSPQPPTPYLSAEESMQHFELPEGYSLELVLSDPDIEEPVICVFDGNGRLFVAEMRTYMQDINGSNKFEKISRVSMHEDSNGDGQLDKHTVFIDKLLLPRMLLPLDDRLIVGETNTLDLYSYRDTNGDGVADEKKLIYKGGERGGNLEHQPSGLIWSMDNWLYTTYNAYRLRLTRDGEMIKEPTAANGGQWGLTQDNYGKPWYVNAGGEIGPINFQQPIVYGAFNVPDQYPPDYREVYPLILKPRQMPDVQGGTLRYHPSDKTLNHFTATCGAEIYRGDRLPKDLQGDLLFSEPVGRLIRRSKITVKDGVTYLKNAYNNKEFIRSTDANFRAVNMTTAPDGTLYIVDMYRGIIQEGNWVAPGSYLRKVVQQYQLDKNFARGRIYRLVHKDFKPGPQPRMLEQSPADWVQHLSHANGWWRDTAQKLLIVKGDTSVAPALKTMARSHDNPLARMHALWTLEGLDLWDKELLLEKMADKDPAVRTTAIRISETLFKKGDQSLLPPLHKIMTSDPDPGVVVQAMMSSKLLKLPDYKKQIETTIAKSSSHGVKEFGNQLIKGAQSGPSRLTADQIKSMKNGALIFNSLCFACYAQDGKGMPIPGSGGQTMAASFVGSKTLAAHPDMSINVVLHGLTGPVDGKTFPGEMIAMKSNGDEWVADVLSYVRNSFGNRYGFISKQDVAKVRNKNKDRLKPWTIEELRAAVPYPLPNRKQWKLSASHNQKSIHNAVDGEISTRYDTAGSQQPGMWFQIELPQATTISSLVLDTTGSNGDYPVSYTVHLSKDGKQWGQPVAKGGKKQVKTRMSINWPEQKARFIKITQTGAKSSFWSIHELDVLGRSSK
ncbi:MAG: discoidin domain-containing protein [Verrucomicrobiota bacterium]